MRPLDGAALQRLPPLALSWMPSCPFRLRFPDLTPTSCGRGQENSSYTEQHPARQKQRSKSRSRSKPWGEPRTPPPPAPRFTVPPTPPSRLLPHPGPWFLTAQMTGEDASKSAPGTRRNQCPGSSAAPRYRPAPVHREGASGPGTWPQHRPGETASVCRCWPRSHPRRLRRRRWRIPDRQRPRWGQLAAGNDERLYSGIGEHPGHVAVPAEAGHHPACSPASPIRASAIEQACITFEFTSSP